MKKNYAYFLALFFVYFNSTAQLTLTKAANEPVSGDTRSMTRHDSGLVVPKSTGTNQSWNFTSLVNPSTFAEVTTYTTVTSTPGAALYPGATLAALRGGNDYEYYKSSGSNWEFMGDMNTANTKTFVLSNTGVFAVWPISMGSSNTDIASGTQTNSSGTAPLSATISYVASGTGTLTFPNGMVQNNVLQVITSLSVAMGTGTNASSSTQITYGYYSSLRKQPIVEIEYNTEITSTGTTKEFSAYVDAIGVVGISQIPTENKEFNVYPVPAGNGLNVVFPGQKAPESIEIFDLNGKLLISSHHATSLDISCLPESCYLMKVTGNERTYQRILPVVKN
jgi:hypothetical protein